MGQTWKSFQDSYGAEPADEQQQQCDSNADEGFSEIHNPDEDSDEEDYAEEDSDEEQEELFDESVLAAAKAQVRTWADMYCVFGLIGCAQLAYFGYLNATTRLLNQIDASEEFETASPECVDQLGRFYQMIKLGGVCLRPFAVICRGFITSVSRTPLTDLVASDI